MMTNHRKHARRTLPAVLVAAQIAVAPAVAAPRAAPPAAPAAGPARADYALGPGDKLRITVFGEDNLTGEYIVTSAGGISFPLIGEIHAAGEPLSVVQERIRTKLAAGYLRDPRVAVEVLEYRTFYILGEVNKPGEYPFRNDLTVEQAVATAGGYTYRAKHDRIMIRHSADAGETAIKLKQAGGLRVLPGDTIRVVERFF